MSLEQDHEAGHNMAGHDASGAEAGTGGLAAPNVVIRKPDGSPLQSLDTNHDNVVGRAEMNPPRPEDGHDLLVAGGALAAAALLVAAAAGVQHFRFGRR
jgi:hypothetical protein